MATAIKIKSVCHVIKASRLREEAHTMGSICMSENCTELKNLRSLVRVCEIQATLREQRWEQYLVQSQHSKNTSIQVQTLKATVVSVSPTGYCFWDSKSKNLKSWRIRILSWSENFWLRVEAGVEGKRGEDPLHIVGSWRGEQLISCSWAQSQHTQELQLGWLWTVGLGEPRGKHEELLWEEEEEEAEGWGGLQDSFFVKTHGGNKNVDFL